MFFHFISYKRSDLLSPFLVLSLIPLKEPITNTHLKLSFDFSQVAMALVATCLVLRCYFNNPSHTPVPNWVRHVVLGWMARLTKVPVKKILHGIDPKESLKKTPSTSTSTEENETSAPEPAVHKKIANTSQNHLSSSQQLHVKPGFTECAWRYSATIEPSSSHSTHPKHTLSSQHAACLRQYPYRWCHE